MNAKTFFSKVAMMRKLQQEYFKSRTPDRLKKCKAIEAEIDAEISRVNERIRSTDQTTLFQ